MKNIKKIKKELQSLANPKQAENLQRYFKTGKGEYGEGDVFLGIKIWDLRDISEKFSELNLDELTDLFNSPIHEHRLTGLLILLKKYKKENNNKKFIDFYLKNTKNINNWNLVDISAPNILGAFLLNKDRDILYKLAKSDNLWEKRIAIVSTLAFIRENQFEETLAISEILLNDSHDLIHKAVGWMLREVGKKNQEVLEDFLKKHYRNMPRTSLRYAIERFEEEKRKKYLKGEF